MAGTQLTRAANWAEKRLNWFQIRGFMAFRGKSLVSNAFIYLVLLSLGFIFMYPVLYMLTTSVMGSRDLISPYVVWVPTQFNLYNYYLAAVGLRFDMALKSSIILAVLGSLAQTASCAVVGYGFARYKFFGRGVLFMLVIFTFIVPPQTIMIPLFIQYHKFRWINTYFPFLIPNLLGQGLRGALFVIIFRQFFATMPWELDDAARIDGIGGVRIFWHIMLPLAKSALLVVLLFSFVWHWNDYYLPSIFLRPDKAPLSVRLARLWTDIREYLEVRKMGGGMTEGAGDWYTNPYFQAITSRNEALGMAACVLVIVVPLVLYVFLQRFFTESIERTGLVD